MQGWKGVIEDGKRADWKTFKWLCSSVQHGGCVAQAIERHTAPDGWVINLPPHSCKSVHTVSVYVCGCVLYMQCYTHLRACIDQGVWICLRYICQTCALWIFHRESTRHRLQNCHHDNTIGRNKTPSNEDNWYHTALWNVFLNYY